MRSSHAITIWLLERLDLDVALTGDLLEECARGRSAIWYWRQVLIAVWVGVWGAVRDHKVLALRAVATGCAVNAVWLFLWSKFPYVGLPVRPMISIGLVATLLIILLTQTATGWIVARTHRAHAIPMVLVFVIWLVLWHLSATFSYAKRLLMGSIDQAKFIPYLAWYLAPISIVAVGLLLGGIFGSRPKRQLSAPSDRRIA
jgi:hypothetical protein